MKTHWGIRIAIVVFGLQFAGFAQCADVSGIWTKTTELHPIRIRSSQQLDGCLFVS